jgi:hypothetical protein
MQCETCDQPGTVRVTEINRGKIVDRHFCRQHSKEHLGEPSDQECFEFYEWIVPYFNRHQQLPPADDIATHGRFGAIFAPKVKAGFPDIIAFLTEQIQKRSSAVGGT